MCTVHINSPTTMGPAKRQGTAGENCYDETAKSKRMCADLPTMESCPNRQNKQGCTEPNCGEKHSEKNQCNFDVEGFRSQAGPAKSPSSELSIRQHEHDTFNVGHSSPVMGGVITSRAPSPIPCWARERGNRIRIECVSENDLPSFPECPDWVKPLMYVEYQVGTLIE